MHTAGLAATTMILIICVSMQPAVLPSPHGKVNMGSLRCAAIFVYVRALHTVARRALFPTAFTLSQPGVHPTVKLCFHWVTSAAH